MRLLLDTCSFIWMVVGDESLPPTVADACRDPTNELLLSPASAWEIAIKHAAGKLELTMDPAAFVREGRLRHEIDELPIDEESVLNTARLPNHHKDPFDRIIVSQAIMNACVLVTPDPAVRAYPVRCLW